MPFYSQPIQQFRAPKRPIFQLNFPFGRDTKLSEFQFSDISKIRNLSRQKRDGRTFELLILDVAIHREKHS